MTDMLMQRIEKIPLPTIFFILKMLNFTFLHNFLPFAICLPVLYTQHVAFLQNIKTLIYKTL